MNKIVAIIDDDQKVLDEVEKILEEQIKGVTVVAFRPEQLGILPTRADVFVVDFDMGAISGSEIIRKIRETNKKAYIIGWGVSLESGRKGKVELLSAKANVVIDKHIKNIATVVKTALTTQVRKTGSLHPSSKFPW